jgi:hypothetical protein
MLAATGRLLLLGRLLLIILLQQLDLAQLAHIIIAHIYHIFQLHDIMSARLFVFESLLLLQIELLQLLMNLLWIQLLYVQCCTTSLRTLISLEGMQLVLQGIQLGLLLASLRLASLTRKLLGINLVQEVAILC